MFGGSYRRRRTQQPRNRAAIFKTFSAVSCQLGYNGAIGVVAHRLARLVWKILHDGVNYLEPGQDTNPRARKRRVQKLAQALTRLGYQVALTDLAPLPAPEASA